MLRPSSGFAPFLVALALLLGCNSEEPAIEPTPESVYVHAAGIRLTRLTLNQGVQVELIEGNEIVGPEDYPVALIEGRAMMVQANYLVHTDFEPRELLATLRVRYPDGRDELVRDSLIMVEGDSLEGSLHHSFAWYLDPDEVVDGLRMRADVYEPRPYEPGTEPSPDPDAEGPERLDAPALPWAETDASITADADPMQLHVVLVPVIHEWEDCVSEAPVPSEEVAALRQAIEQNNPVQSAVFSVREPVIWTDTIGESEDLFSPILTMLSMLRVEDDAAPYVYYYGLVSSCDGYPNGLLGQALIPLEIDPGLAYQRVAAGRYAGSGAASAETFVHELGHSQGRRHVRCSGEGGVDPDYPHTGGLTGGWGFGLYDLGLRAPGGAHDYMTYCGNAWVSDYGYNKTWPVIETLTQWAIEDAEAREHSGMRAGSNDDFDEILVGALYPSGDLQWWITRGSISGEVSSRAAVRWELDGEQLELPVWVSSRADDETLNLATVLPVGRLEHHARFMLEVEGLELGGIELRELEAEIELDSLHRPAG